VDSDIALTDALRMQDILSERLHRQITPKPAPAERAYRFLEISFTSISGESISIWRFSEA
jgi:hypothetical protein